MNLILALLLISATPAPEPKAILYLVTASWCAHCPAQYQVIERLQADGKLAGIAWGILDADKDKAIIQGLVGDNIGQLPQLILYRPAGRLTGLQSAEDIEAMIRGEPPRKVPVSDKVKWPTPIPPDIDMPDVVPTKTLAAPEKSQLQQQRQNALAKPYRFGVRVRP